MERPVPYNYPEELFYLTTVSASGGDLERLLSNIGSTFQRDGESILVSKNCVVFPAVLEQGRVEFDIYYALPTVQMFRSVIKRYIAAILGSLWLAHYTIAPPYQHPYFEDRKQVKRGL